MQIIENYAVKKLTDILKVIRAEPVQWRCIYIPSLDDLPKILDRVSLEVNILLKDVYKAYLFPMPNNDVFFFCRGGDEKLMKTIMEIIQEVSADEDLQVDAKLFDLSCNFEQILLLAKPYLAVQKEKGQTDVQSLPKNSSVPELTVDVIDSQIVQQMKETRRSSNKLTVMLVDDEPMTLKMVEAILNDCHVIKCTSPQQALNEYFIEAPHVVFMDINMPPYSGHDLLEKIKQYDTEAYIVMLSANAYPADIKKVMAAGAKGFIGKPFSKAKIFNYLLAYQKLMGRKLL